ncbi:MAG: DedA family protein [Parcubacteria group bacterium]
MIAELLARLTDWATGFISTTGYAGLFGLLFLDAINIPMPSELTLGFGGYMVSIGRLSFWGATLAGSLGYSAGAVASYWIGRLGGRPLVERYGKYFLISRRDLARADRLLGKYGNAITFFSRMVPVLRTFISMPAGVCRIPFGQYVIYTVLGSTLWAVIFVYLGNLVGENYKIIGEKLHGIEYVIAGALLLGIVAWIVHFVKEQREIRRELANQPKTPITK